MHPIYDQTTGQIEQVIADNSKEIIAISNEILTSVLAPLQPFSYAIINRKKSCQLLQECFQIAENIFCNVASKKSLDIWMPILRRFPPRPYCYRGWENYLTLGLLRYSFRKVNSTIIKLYSKNQFGIAYEFTDELVFDAFRLDSLANQMARIANVYRWIGKGAELHPTLNNLTHFVASKELEESIDHYEARRPKNFIFADEGLLVNISIENIEYPLFLLYTNNKTLRMHDPLNDIYLLLHYIPFTVDARPVIKVLRYYEEPIQDIFGVSVDSIAHVLYAASRLITTTFPKIGNITKDCFELIPNDNIAEYQHRLKFLFGICQNGVLHFEREHWVKRLSEVISPWSSDSKKGKILVEEFLDAFIYSDDKYGEIDLSLLRPIPFAFQSCIGEVYFDFTTTLEFVAWILDRAKEWYSTQHGDYFTLMLKKLIESQTKAKIISWKKIINIDNERAEVDLLVSAGAVLYAIECKAFRKSREFIRGDLNAINYRRKRIRDSVIQAKGTLEIVRKAIEKGDISIPSITRIEWIVCTPTQEFLKPFHEHGVLTDEIPRVCTPEELLGLLTRAVVI
jgi:hypothetical protein